MLRLLKLVLFEYKYCWFEWNKIIENWSLLLLVFSYSLGGGYKIIISYSRNVQRPTSNSNTYNNSILTNAVTYIRQTGTYCGSGNVCIGARSVVRGSGSVGCGSGNVSKHDAKTQHNTQRRSENATQHKIHNEKTRHSTKCTPKKVLPCSVKNVVKKRLAAKTRNVNTTDSEKTLWKNTLQHKIHNVNTTDSEKNVVKKHPAAQNTQCKHDR